jgi:hypothetical protein
MATRVRLPLKDGRQGVFKLDGALQGNPVHLGNCTGAEAPRIRSNFGCDWGKDERAVNSEPELFELNGLLFFVATSRAFESSKIMSGLGGLDARECHRHCALGAARQVWDGLC